MTLLQAGLALALSGLAATAAQAQRTVMLDICNDTPVRIATAAVYQTQAGGPETLRTWFLVEPGACLQGGLNGVAGAALDLHAMTGEWRWPARGGDRVWCVPAAGTTQAATGAPCGAAQQARDFRRVPIELTSQRGAGGMVVGRVSWRVRCNDLALADAQLCPFAPADEQGLAQPVRTLEVCNSFTQPVEIAVLESRPGDAMVSVASETVPAGACVDAYRGFPPDQTVFLAAIGSRLFDGDGDVCLQRGGQTRAAQPVDGGCPEGQEASTYRRYTFGERVARYTAELGR
jgi:hypothetical protein